MRTARYGPFLLVGLVLLTFSPLFTAEFVRLDDPYTLHQNPRLNPPSRANVAAYWREWRTGESGLYIPMTYTAWSGLASLARTAEPDDNGIRLNPWVFHAANVLVHAASTLLVFALLRALLADARAALLAAMVFAVHPIQVEAVAWASGLKDLLAGMLALGAIVVYVRAAQRAERAQRVRQAQRTQDARTTSPRAGGASAEPSGPGAAAPPALGEVSGEKEYRQRFGGWLSAIVYTALFLLACLAKPSALVVGPICLVLDLLLVRRDIGRAIRSALPMLVLAVPVALIARHVQDVAQVTPPALWQRPFVAADAIVFYLGKLLIPFALAIDYGRRPEAILARPVTYAIAIVPILLAFLVWRSRQRTVAAAAAFFVLALAPVLGLATFQFQMFSTVTDHYAYLAMAAVALIVGWLIALRPTRATVIVASALIGLLAVRSFAQARVWHDDFTLFGHALKVNPASFLAHNNLAGAYEARGADPASQASALRHYEAAARVNPSFRPAHAHRAALYRAQGQPDRAAGAMLTWLKLTLDLPERARGNYLDAVPLLADDLLASGQPGEAVRFLSLYLQARPQDSAAARKLDVARAEAATRPAPPPAALPAPSPAAPPARSPVAPAATPSSTTSTGASSPIQ